MVQTTAAEAPDRFGDDQFPILFDNGLMRVYKNPSNEIFVEDIQSGATMRINSGRYGGLEFTTDSRVEPTRVSNIIGWHISPR